jgi:hypothetical protein
MTPSQILQQLYYGLHLEPDELKRAEGLLRELTKELKTRTRKETK